MQNRQEAILGALAQLVEQRTFNPFVVGSTPAGPTSIYKRLAEMLDAFLFLDVTKT